MKKFLIILLFLNGCAAQSYMRALNVYKNIPGADEQKYVSGISDLPLYHGFKEINDNIASYDSLEGRIITASYYSRKADAEDVRSYYNITLPQLGWKESEYQIYQREGEVLRINILEKNKKIVLKFSVRPVG